MKWGARLTAFVWLPALSAFLVWNGVFGLHVSQGETRYLLAQARSEVARHEAPSMSAIMAEAVQVGVRRASWWALVAGGITLTAALLAARAVRHPTRATDIDEDDA